MANIASPPDEPQEPQDAPPVDPVLADVVRRGDSIRRQQRFSRIAVIALVVQLALGLPLLASRVGDDDDTRVRSAAPASRVDASDRETTTTNPLSVTIGLPSIVATTTTARPPATTATTARPVAATTTTPPARCRNSTDPACGPFRWDPAPGANAPTDVTITSSSASPRAGESVRFTVRAVDPDAPDLRWSTGLCVTPANPARAECSSGPTFTSCSPHGPWTPPARRPFDRTEPWDVTFSQPGSYQVSATVQTMSHSCERLDAYGSRGTRTITVVVEPAD